MAKFERKRNNIDKEKNRLEKTWIHPDKTDAATVQEILGQPLQKEANLMDLLRRPEVCYQDLVRLAQLDAPLQDQQTIRQLEIQARYSGYIDRQIAEIERQKSSDNRVIPNDIDYTKARGLSSEAQQKLTTIRPQTIGQAARIPGVTPAAISLLLIYLKAYPAKRSHKANA